MVKLHLDPQVTVGERLVWCSFSTCTSSTTATACAARPAYAYTYACCTNHTCHCQGLSLQVLSVAVQHQVVTAACCHGPAAATSVKRQSFAPRQAGLKLATDTSGRISNSGSASSPRAAAVVGQAEGPGSNISNGSNSASISKPGAQPATPAELGLSASHSHPRMFSSEGGTHHQQQQDDELAGVHGSGGSGTSSSIQGQLQMLRAHHAGLMRLGLLMALTM